MINKLLTLLTLFAVGVAPALADYKITQKRTTEDVSFTSTIYAKGVRERRESKIEMAGMEAEEAQMMASMMPNLTEITQCDLKQNVSINDPKRSFFVDYYDWSSLPPEKLKRRPNQKVVIKGTSTVSSTVTDSGKRKQMFGMTAKWLKAVQTIENSFDSCDGAASVRIEQEGWFVDLTLSQERCQTPQIPGERGGCRPKMIVKSSQDPGFLLEGTIKNFENNKLSVTSKVETTDLSLTTLDQALFEIPKGYKEVDSLSELFGAANAGDNTAITLVDGNKSKSTKTVAIDFFSGNASKLDQTELRSMIADRLNSAGMSGFPINSQAEIISGNFANVIGVEIRKLKESGASKVGGLFGKVTGVDASKAGESEAEVVVTVYGKDGKTVVASNTAAEKVSGKGQDAAKAAILKALNGVIDKIK